MSFPRDAYPYTNFHELNLGYFITHFREIFSQWADLYDQMTDWKDATDEELATWKTGVEADLDQREAALRAELETWKAQTGQDIAGWEDATLAALTAWQTATQAVFEAIRVEAAGSATAAAASAGDAATAKTAAETAQAAAEAAAASVQTSAAQIATNTADIADLKTHIGTIDKGIDYPKATLFTNPNTYILNTGYTGTSNNYACSDPIPVKAGEVIYYDLQGYNGNVAIAFYDSETGISGFEALVLGTGIPMTGYVSIANDGYIRVACLNLYISNGTPHIRISGYLDKRINEINAEIDAIDTNIESMETEIETQGELFLANTHTAIDPETITLEWIEGSYYDLSTGIVTPLATYARTEKMACKAGDTFIIDPSAGQIVWFKADGTVSYSGTNQNNTVYRAAPANTIYFALNNNNASIRASNLIFKSIDDALIKTHVIAPAKLLCDVSAFTARKYASTSDGSITDLASFKCLMHYPVKANHKYRTAHQTQVVFYASNLTFISSLLPGGAAGNTGTAVEMDFTTPNNCAFICVNTNKSFEMLFDVDEYDIAGFISNPSKLSNKTVLSFGDSITGNYNFGDNIIYEVEKFCGAKTYNAGFGGCRMEKINESGSAAEVAALTNPFAMCEIVDQLALPDTDPTKWAAQDAAAADFEAAPRYNRIIKFRLGILKEIDISKIDIITIAYGTNEAGYTQDDEQNPYNKYTYAGATRYSIEKLLEINPKLRIVLLTPIYRHSFGSGTTGDSDTYVNASTGLGLLDNIETLKNVGLEYKIPVIDLYHDLGINKENYTAYFGDDDEPDDGTHINTYGREEYGRRLAGELSRLM